MLSWPPEHSSGIPRSWGPIPTGKATHAHLLLEESRVVCLTTDGHTEVLLEIQTGNQESSQTGERILWGPDALKKDLSWGNAFTLSFAHPLPAVPMSSRHSTVLGRCNFSSIHSKKNFLHPTCVGGLHFIHHSYQLSGSLDLATVGISEASPHFLTCVVLSETHFPPRKIQATPLCQSRGSAVPTFAVFSGFCSLLLQPF